MKKSHRIRTILALIALSAITWMVAQPQSATPAYAQEAEPAAAGPATATIRGTVLKPDGSPAIGAEIKVGVNGYEKLPDGSVRDGELSEWLFTTTDPDTATFVLTVPAVPLLLNFGLPVDGSGDEYDAFARSSQGVKFTPSENETVNQDLTLIALDSTIRGSVLTPDGTAISEGRVWVSEWLGSYYGIPKAVRIIDGVFETQVIAGGPHTIDVDNDGSRQNTEQHIERGMVLPNSVEIMADPVGTNEVVVQLASLDATITGQIYHEQELLKNENLSVSLWENGGKYSYTEGKSGSLSGTPTLSTVVDGNGRFTISVPSGFEWIILASTPFDDYANADLEVSYWGSSALIDITESKAYEMDLSVSSVLHERDDTTPDTTEQESTGLLDAESNSAGTTQMTDFIFLPVLVR